MMKKMGSSYLVHAALLVFVPCVLTSRDTSLLSHQGILQLLGGDPADTVSLLHMPPTLCSPTFMLESWVMQVCASRDEAQWELDNSGTAGSGLHPIASQRPEHESTSTYNIIGGLGTWTLIVICVWFLEGATFYKLGVAFLVQDVKQGDKVWLLFAHFYTRFAVLSLYLFHEPAPWLRSACVAAYALSSVNLFFSREVTNSNGSTGCCFVMMLFVLKGIVRAVRHLGISNPWSYALAWMLSIYAPITHLQSWSHISLKSLMGRPFGNGETSKEPERLSPFAAGFMS
ncbi:hypothetical protein WJX84_010852 [Apatococcus fuscideae]|uniref:Uncharacterized protein n=1 Tax=Apatococcus fuscideae TaxID=2026836 RepID=A0AAW1TP58_9CHLO